MLSRVPFIATLLVLALLWILYFRGVLVMPDESAKTLHAWFNRVECAIWIVAGAWVLRRTWRQASPRRAAGALATAAFAAFAVSDVAEIQTGAWYRPWWLLAWKAACIACLIFCFVRFRSLRTSAGGR